MHTSTSESNPYLQCPVYETDRFLYRLVRMEDAADLLQCYSDPASLPLFNGDNCNGQDFHFRTIEEMNTCIYIWLDQYSRQAYIRFSIVDKASEKAVGTLEFFARDGKASGDGTPEAPVGLLRLDLASPYEREELLGEIAELVEAKLYDAFQVDRVITKIVPSATQRIRAFAKRGFKELPDGTLPFDHYYIQTRTAR